ncbi:adenylate/guanylate cyclase domain-containing protein [Allorhizobium borbori]|uniref:Adenylate cyclase n=1 Tax=Allorhizobium borbori TaxID=485907 RepID=A0A7W6P2F6_9HYPH|nr:adenylate/guanylate cyclase domain-containing protein [Allorhizobium borbori]MBB4105364.1 adenylate cyclase [Allorhizobium borbori]
MNEKDGVPSARSTMITHSIREWLLKETRTERYIDNILVSLCERLRSLGVPVARSTLHFQINNPQWLGASIQWVLGAQAAQINTFEYGTENTQAYRQSPISEILSGADEVRENLLEEHFSRPYSIFEQLRQEGYTDYIAFPLDHTLGKRHVMTLASDAPDGFDCDDIRIFREMVPILSLVSEVRIKNALARTLMQTYVGPHASEEILAGATTRGSGVTLSAAVLIFDIRDFTSISDISSRDDVIDMLNTYFDAIAEPIEQHRGEILKFMGDGLLAVFPLENEHALNDIFTAVMETRQAIDNLNTTNLAMGKPLLRYGIGVHVGEVMYGNIGSRRRLDFTAIGPTVNVASRLESLTKTVHHPILFSEAFVKQGKFEAFVDGLGEHALRGLANPVSVFALKPGGIPAIPTA